MRYALVVLGMLAFAPFAFAADDMAKDNDHHGKSDDHHTTPMETHANMDLVQMKSKMGHMQDQHTAFHVKMDALQKMIDDAQAVADKLGQ